MRHKHTVWVFCHWQTRLQAVVRGVVLMVSCGRMVMQPTADFLFGGSNPCQGKMPAASLMTVARQGFEPPTKMSAVGCVTIRLGYAPCTETCTAPQAQHTACHLLTTTRGSGPCPYPGAGHVQLGRLLPVDNVCKAEAAELTVLRHRRWMHSATRRGGGGGGWGQGTGRCGGWGSRSRASKGGWVGDPTISAKNTLCNTVGVLNYSLYP